MPARGTGPSVFNFEAHSKGQGEERDGERRQLDAVEAGAAYRGKLRHVASGGVAAGDDARGAAVRPATLRLLPGASNHLHVGGRYEVLHLRAPPV